MATSSAPDEVLYFGGHQHDGEQFYYWIGRTITSWADVEHQIFQLFIRCIPQNRRLAEKIFDKPPTVSLKLQLVDDALSTCLLAARYKEWGIIYKSINKHIKLRNALAHNPVHTRTSTSVTLDGQVAIEFGPTVLIHFLNAHAHKKPSSAQNWIGLQDIKDHFGNVQTIVTDLRRFSISLPKKLRAPQIKLPQQQSGKQSDSASRQKNNGKPTQAQRRPRKSSPD